jgi:membrane protease YdiL (CAAX protease family)
MTSVPPPQAPAAHPAPPRLPEVPDGVTPAPQGRSGWRPWTAWASIVAALAAATIVGGIVFAIGGDFDDPPPAVNIIATVVQDLCFIGAALMFAALAGRPWLSQFGLRPPRSLKAAVGYVALGYVAFLVFTAVFLTLIGKTDSSDDLPQELGADESTVALVAVAFLVTVMAPLAEEFLFRGYFFGALRNWRGFWPAAVLTGCVFGGIHAGSSNLEFLLPLAVLGFVLCWIYEKTGSLYPCIALHCLNNSIAFGSSQDWTWQIPLVLVSALGLIAGIIWAAQRLTGGAAPAPASA